MGYIFITISYLGALSIIYEAIREKDKYNIIGGILLLVLLILGTVYMEEVAIRLNRFGLDAWGK